MSITRRMFFRGAAAIGAASGLVSVATPSDANPKDDGPLLADDATGTTAYADWHERKYGTRPADPVVSGDRS